MYANGIGKLRMEGCQLKLIPAILLQFNKVQFNLREIYISKNKISKLDKIIFELPNLTHLDVSYNDLSDENMLQKVVGIEYKNLKCKYLH